jgi:hypothetical protein
MASLKRGWRKRGRPVPADREGGPTAPAPPSEQTELAWIAPAAGTDVPAPDSAADPASEWLPPGVAPSAPREERPFERRASQVLPALGGPESAPAPAEPAPPAPAPPAPAPPATAAAPSAPPADPSAPAVEELQERLAALERELAETREHAAALEQRSEIGGAPSPAEVESVADAQRQLQRSVQDLRGAIEQQGGAQQQTIRALEARLSGFEDELRSPLLGVGRRISTAARIVLLVVVFVAIAGAPLFILHRSTCIEGRQAETHWAFVVPGLGDEPKGCHNETGATVLLDAVGLQ